MGFFRGWGCLESKCFPFEYLRRFVPIGCSDGWYGVNCSQQCVEHCRDGTSCSQVNGHCDRGCDAGWTGFICEKRNYTQFFPKIHSYKSRHNESFDKRSCYFSIVIKMYQTLKL